MINTSNKILCLLTPSNIALKIYFYIFIQKLSYHGVLLEFPSTDLQIKNYQRFS